MFKRFLLSYVLLCILPFVILGVLLSSLTSDIVGQELLNAAEISLDESYNSLKRMTDNAHQISLTLATDPAIQQKLQQYHDNPQDTESLRNLEEMLRVFPQYGGATTKLRMALVNEPSPTADSSNDFYYELVETVDPANIPQWLQKSILSPNRFIWTRYAIDNSTYLRQVKGIYDMRDWKTIIGYIMVDVNLENMRSLTLRTDNTSRLYLVEAGGLILYPYYNYDNVPVDVLKQTQAGTYGGEQQLFLVRPVLGTDWTLVKSVSLGHFRERTQSIRNTILWVAFLFTVLSLLAALYFYTRISKPVTRLSRRMHRVQAGEMVPVINGPQKGEIGELYQSYNYMIGRLQEQIERIYVIQLNAKEAELKALQAQINPHFLYNTLDSISWLALRYQATDISDMVIALSDMLRFSLNKGDIIILLADELRQVNSYITLQKIRYSNRFDVLYKISDNTKNCRIVKMLLQPLVENAIIHGFEEIESGGLITIKAHCEQDMLYLEVSNNGTLIDLALLEQRVQDPNRNALMHGYGIKNVNERLASFYGSEYTIHYAIRDGLTVASLCIPHKVVNHHDERSHR